MKTLSIPAYSVLAYLDPLASLQWTGLHTTLLTESFEEINEFHWENMCHPYFCKDSSSWSMFPMRIALVYGLLIDAA